ncbi:MAG: amidase family protein, partial [Planctomycetia bacterium]
LDAEVAAAVQAAVKNLESLGATVVEVDLPHAKYCIATYYLVATAEASSNLARYDGIHYGHRAAKFADLETLYSASRSEGFGAEVKRRIMLGTFSLSEGYRDAYYVKALQVRRLIKNDFDAAFEKVDCIVGPVAPTPAFERGAKTADPLAMYLEDVYTVSANLAGIPGLSIPCGFSAGGLPIGLQLQGPPFSEEKLLAVGALFQNSTEHHRRRPTS